MVEIAASQSHLPVKLSFIPAKMLQAGRVCRRGPSWRSERERIWEFPISPNQQVPALYAPPPPPRDVEQRLCTFWFYKTVSIISFNNQWIAFNLAPFDQLSVVNMYFSSRCLWSISLCAYDRWLVVGARLWIRWAGEACIDPAVGRTHCGQYKRVKTKD